jgi:Flp pilus assembly protein TadG
MHALRRFHGDEKGTEMVEFVVGATLIIAIMMLIMVSLWNTTHERAAATNTIITDNVPTAAQP